MQREYHRRSGFFRLPTELVQQIFNLLDPEDRLNQRLVCKDFYNISFDEFGKTYLEDFHSDLTPYSLQMLEEIGNHEGYKTYVKHLTVTERKSVGRYGLGGAYSRDENGLLNRDQPITNTLRDLLTKLTSCRSFTIQDNPDFTYPSIRWNNKVSLSFADAVQIFLSLIDQTGIHVEKFKVFNDSRCKLLPDKLDSNTHQAENFKRAWSISLQELELPRLVDPENYSFGLQLMWMATNLQSLTICVRDETPLPSPDSRILRKYRDGVPQIQRLKLSHYTNTSQSHLFNFISVFKSSLTSLTLDHIRLKSGNFVTFFGQFKGQPTPKLTELLIIGVSQPYESPPEPYNISTRGTAQRLSFCKLCYAANSDRNFLISKEPICFTRTREVSVNCDVSEMNQALECLERISFLQPNCPTCG